MLPVKLQRPPPICCPQYLGCVYGSRRQPYYVIWEATLNLALLSQLDFESALPAGFLKMIRILAFIQPFQLDSHQFVLANPLLC